MNKKSFRVALVAIAVSGLLFLIDSCSTTGAWLVIRKTPPQEEKHQPRPEPVRRYPRVDNNQTVRLESGEYRGDLRIRANNVTIIGRGTGVTTIRGNVIVDGNSVAIRDLTIVGNVTINGNSADLRQARIEGRVDAYSKNSSW